MDLFAEDQRRGDLLKSAAKQGRLDLLEEQTAEHPLIPEEIDLVFAAAVRRQQLAVLRWLFERFPDLRAEQLGYAALSAGVAKGDPEFVGWLTGFAPVDRLGVEMAFADACDSGHLEVAELLLERLRITKGEAEQAFFDSAEACELPAISWLVEKFGFNFADDCRLTIEVIGRLCAEKEGFAIARTVSELMHIPDGRLCEEYTELLVRDLEEINRHGYRESAAWLMGKFRIAEADMEKYGTEAEHKKAGLAAGAPGCSQS